MGFDYVLPASFIREVRVLVDDTVEHAGILRFCGERRKRDLCRYNVNGGNSESVEVRGMFCAGFHTHPAPCTKERGCAYFAPSAIDMRTYAEQARRQSGFRLNYVFTAEGITAVITEASAKISSPRKVEATMLRLQRAYWDDEDRARALPAYRRAFREHGDGLGFRIVFRAWPAALRRGLALKTRSACGAGRTT